MNTFGRIFKISIFGESHGESTGVIIDGCPAGISLSATDLADDLTRRRPGAKGTTGRIEKDMPQIKSGLFKGFTTGSPILIEFTNENTVSSDYLKYKTVPRPGHVDFIAAKKHSDYNDHRGGGHFSGRITVGLVAAGVIAKKILRGVIFKTSLIEVGGEKNYKELVDETAKSGDSLGGIIECRIDHLPLCLGEPFFYSAESALSHILFAIPSVKGVEFGTGFGSSLMKGSDYNDALIDSTGKTKTNNSGGITGGLTNGNQLVFRVAMRPPSSIAKKQTAYDLIRSEIASISIDGRHDVCPALRAAVIVEAAASIALCDLYLLSKCNSNNGNIMQI